MKKININTKISDEILNKYKSGISMRKLEKEYDYSFTFIKKIIESNNFEKKIQINYPIVDNLDIVAVCKKTKKEFYDYSNSSGVITKHLTNTLNIDLLSKYKRKSIEYQTGKFWYDKYFNFEYRDKKQIKKCQYCEWTTTDISNNSGSYKKHLKKVHNINIDEHLRITPDDLGFFKDTKLIDGVVCKICGESFKMITAKHLDKHNITMFNYKMKYDEQTVSKTSHDKLSKSTIKTNKTTTKSKTSKAENEIRDFLKSYDINILQSTRKYLDGIEIDLYSKEHSIGIEYNGNIYHSENYGKKNRNYHLNKTKTALKNNIYLYHIHEDEWEYNKEIVKNKLLHLFNKNNAKKIYARNCIINEISSQEKSKFLNKYHLQGNDKSTINLGAYYNNELCAVMTFTNKRNMNKRNEFNDNSYDLSRFVTSSKFIIVGIAGKLLKTFIKLYNPTKIISFADRKWTPNIKNNLYTKLGFKCTNIGYPDYMYYKKSEHRGKRLHKFGFGKSSLKRKFPEKYDKNKTEWEMMQELGYDRIWDCGKLTFELNI